MLIDWFTVSAQIINFLILVYLLKRFLYGPVIRAMDEREQKIADRLREAEEKRRNADAEAKELANQRRELAANRKELEDEARREVEQWREDAVAKVREEAEEMRKSWRESIDSEKEDFVQRFKSVLSRQVFQIAADVLRDLADERLEKKLVEAFNRKLAEVVGEGEKSAGEMGDQLRFIAGFELDDELQSQVENVVDKIFPGVKVRFESDSGLGFGVRLVGDNRKIEWGLSRHMTELENRILASMQLQREAH